MGNYYEIIGYVASLIVLISLLMSSVKKLRWINMIGSVIFALYGFLIGAIPVALMNLGIVMINIYYLTQMYAQKDYFTLMPSTDENYLNQFMNFHKENMKNFITIDGIDFEDHRLTKLFVLRNMIPAGVIIGRATEDHTFEILVDYVTPTFRDFKIGKFLYQEHVNYFLDQGYKKLITIGHQEVHQKYLIKMGFVENNGLYIKKLD